MIEYPQAEAKNMPGPKEEAMTEICVLGDSLSRGVVFSDEKKRYVFSDNCFTKLLEREGFVNIKNLAKYGCTIGAAAGILEKHVKDAASADYCVIELGGNDSDFDWKQVSDFPESEHQPFTPLEKFTAAYTSVIRRIRELGGKPLAMNLMPIDSGRYFRWFSKGKSVGNLLKWLGGSDRYIYRWHEMYSLTVCKIAKKFEVPLIDIRSAFLRQRDFSSLLCSDGIHPNEEGHRLIADVLKTYICRGTAD